MWDDDAIADPDTRGFGSGGVCSRGLRPTGSRGAPDGVPRFQREQAARRPEEPRDRVQRFLNTRVHLRSASTGPSALREDFEHALWVLAGIAALVLLIACANVASLLVARASAREREMALRVSIGAGRGRLVQQVLVENGLLALASCALGSVLAIVTAPESCRCCRRRSRSCAWMFDWTGADRLPWLRRHCRDLPVRAGPGHPRLDRLARRRAEIGAGRQTARIGVFRLSSRHRWHSVSSCCSSRACV